VGASFGELAQVADVQQVEAAVGEYNPPELAGGALPIEQLRQGSTGHDLALASGFVWETRAHREPPRPGVA
jgi:hypothetical protein